MCKHVAGDCNALISLATVKARPGNFRTDNLIQHQKKCPYSGLPYKDDLIKSWTDYYNANAGLKSSCTLLETQDTSKENISHTRVVLKCKQCNFAGKVLYYPKSHYPDSKVVFHHHDFSNHKCNPLPPEVNHVPPVQTPLVTMLRNTRINIVARYKDKGIILRQSSATGGNTMVSCATCLDNFLFDYHSSTGNFEDNIKSHLESTSHKSLTNIRKITSLLSPVCAAPKSKGERVDDYDNEFIARMCHGVHRFDDTAREVWSEMQGRRIGDFCLENRTFEFNKKSPNELIRHVTLFRHIQCENFIHPGVDYCFPDFTCSACSKIHNSKEFKRMYDRRKSGRLEKTQFKFQFNDWNLRSLREFAKEKKKKSSLLASQLRTISRLKCAAKTDDPNLQDIIYYWRNYKKEAEKAGKDSSPVNNDLLTKMLKDSIKNKLSLLNHGTKVGYRHDSDTLRFFGLLGNIGNKTVQSLFASVYEISESSAEKATKETLAHFDEGNDQLIFICMKFQLELTLELF
jgi:hypothetical protein